LTLNYRYIIFRGPNHATEILMLRMQPSSKREFPCPFLLALESGACGVILRGSAIEKSG
jgi:hypothetical protein